MNNKMTARNLYEKRKYTTPETKIVQIRSELPLACSQNDMDNLPPNPGYYSEESRSIWN